MGLLELQVVLTVKNLLANVGDVRDTSLIPGTGRSPEGGQGKPLQYSCLENPINRGAWRATMGSQRVGHSEATEHAYTHTDWKKLKNEKNSTYKAKWLPANPYKGDPFKRKLLLFLGSEL